MDDESNDHGMEHKNQSHAEKIASENHGDTVKNDTSTKKLDDVDSMNKLLSGTYTSGWRAKPSPEDTNEVAPGTLITDHPEALLHEGRIINYFECPDCGFMIEVTTKKRPIEITCGACSSRFRLKGKKKEPPKEDNEEESKPLWDVKSELAEKAMNYHKHGDLNKAIEMYDEILVISANDPVVWNNKGVALDGLGMHILAVKCYEKSINLREGYVDAWFNLAYSQFEMKQFEKATESLRTVVRLKPDHSEANLLLDKCEEELRQWKRYLD